MLETALALALTSTAFAQGGSIPRVHTCQGSDTSVPLAWSGLPPGTKSLALIVDDPDAPDPAAPKMTWVHWVLYDVPPDVTGLPAGGPCPPIGRHRYFHKLYALDVVLGDLGKPTKARLEAAMKGHVLESFELMGTYQKN
jgi:phosphatidylethanolamine-binding protein (PEBP) family uncharacterized protein